MRYPRIPDFPGLAEQLRLYAQLNHEYGSQGIPDILKRAERSMKTALRELQGLQADPELAAREPNRLENIRRLRPRGVRRIWGTLDQGVYAERVEGALLGRFAGCTLGAPVEGWSVERMRAWAREIGHSFPPTAYWPRVTEPHETRYGMSRRDAYTDSGMRGVPVDDDTVYTLLGLLILEESGPEFTVDDVGAAWLKYLPMACTAEEIALENLRNGVPASRAAVRNNPYVEWIGADIRADPWGYLAPGRPELAAEMGYRDSYLSHRRNGIYGEMYFAAVISAAFTTNDPVEALHVGLEEIPRQCSLAKALRWALRQSPAIRNWRQARAAVDERFAGMHNVHTINNACLTVWGVIIGKRDLTRVISQTVAMGLDNDCTAATAGSIVGAVVGKAGVPEHWYRKFDNTVLSYLTGRRKFTIDGLVRRFSKQAARVFTADGPLPGPSPRPSGTSGNPRR